METQEANETAQGVEKDERGAAQTGVGSDDGAAVGAPAAIPAERISDEQIVRALGDEDVRERLIFGNLSLMNAVIERYLDELAGGKSVPVVRGYASLCPVRKPKTLEEAKRIVDGGGI